LEHILDTTSWFFAVALVLFLGGWLNWDDLSERAWKAKWLVDRIGKKFARIVYLLLLSSLGSLLILRLFGGW
jgi:hypothetical protein